jgi:hypothetical protein
MLTVFACARCFSLVLCRKWVYYLGICCKVFKSNKEHHHVVITFAPTVERGALVGMVFGFGWDRIMRDFLGGERV